MEICFQRVSAYIEVKLFIFDLIKRVFIVGMCSSVSVHAVVLL